MAAKKTPSFEDRLRRLQEVVASLENGELPLEDSVRLYKEGLTLSAPAASSWKKPATKSAFSPRKVWSLLTKRSLTRKGNRTGGGNFL